MLENLAADITEKKITLFILRTENTVSLFYLKIKKAEINGYKKLFAAMKLFQLQKGGEFNFFQRLPAFPHTAIKLLGFVCPSHLHYANLVGAHIGSDLSRLLFRKIACSVQWKVVLNCNKFSSSRKSCPVIYKFYGYVSAILPCQQKYR